MDDIIICSHHSDKGFQGERTEYKIDCECRKPKPGLLLKAAKKCNIDLAVSWMIGDDSRDEEAGKTAGCRTVVLSNGISFLDVIQELGFDCGLEGSVR